MLENEEEETCTTGVPELRVGGWTHRLEAAQESKGLSSKHPRRSQGCALHVLSLW